MSRTNRSGAIPACRVSCTSYAGYQPARADYMPREVPLLPRSSMIYGIAKLVFYLNYFAWGKAVCWEMINSSGVYALYFLAIVFPPVKIKTKSKDFFTLQ
jgi:hypothetical protein